MSPADKTRLDILITDLGIAASREEAQALIRRGAILVNEIPVEKPGIKIEPGATIRCRYQPPRFASRGGEKLDHALKTFELSVKNRVCADLGSSTGGFVDCLLQNGARKVYAIDVGYGQLHESLRTDPRVAVMDRTNARHLSPEAFPDPVEVVTADLSFISLRLVLPAVRAILSPKGWAMLLVKPQFEIGKGRVGKGGIVRQPEDHRDVLVDFIDRANADWTVRGLEPSPIRGKDGNIEFLAWVEPGHGTSAVDIEDIVTKAHGTERTKR
ncbi:MAG: TlyA family RNA methyltransferase [bacterium]